MNKSLNHYVHLVCFASMLVFMGSLSNSQNSSMPENENAVDKYGLVLTCVFYLMKLLTLSVAPISLCNFLGFIMYDLFPSESRICLRRSPLLDPFFTIRIVTRGNYPQLVAANVDRMLNLCLNAGLNRFIIEVVTDSPINLPKNSKLREIVVPDDYETMSGAKFKARALQYALENEVNILADDDWIVHLDEETLLTESSLNGILNFFYEDKHHIGQGLITYGKEGIVNVVTTLADSFRVGSDMGMLRYSLAFLHRPTFTFKGSFIVCKAGVERKVGFDYGIEASIAEDIHFALKAVSFGYSFDWIDGEMHEKSPFSFWDFVQQRKRWIQGISLVVHNPQLSIRNKFWLAYGFYNVLSLPFQIFNILLSVCFPIKFLDIINVLAGVIGGVYLYVLIIGALKSFRFRKYKFIKHIMCVGGVILCIPFLLIAESVAVMLALTTNKKQFYIVKKNQHTISV